jgi:hypothetical protein
VDLATIYDNYLCRDFDIWKKLPKKLEIQNKNVIFVI